MKKIKNDKLKAIKLIKNIKEELVLWHGSVNGIRFPIRVDYSKNMANNV